MINFFFNFLSNIFLKNNNKDYFFFLDSFNKYKFSNSLYDRIFRSNLIVDFVWLVFYSINYKDKFSLNKLFRSNFRILNTKNNFYFNLKNLNSNKNYLNFLKNFNLVGYIYI